jgi:hypothetical protein
MLKVALLVAGALATALATASLAIAANTVPVAVPLESAQACAVVLSLELDCAMRGIDFNGDGTISPAELVSFPALAPVAIDWTPLRPPRSTGLDFKDAATEPATMLSATRELDARHPLLPALFALGALVVLLRRRPL